MCTAHLGSAIETYPTDTVFKNDSNVGEKNDFFVVVFVLSVEQKKALHNESLERKYKAELQRRKRML